jgi:E3 ubiquitin-protein ligase UHRF1
MAVPGQYAVGLTVDVDGEERPLISTGGFMSNGNKKLRPSDLTTKQWGGGMACVGRTKENTDVDKKHVGAIPKVPVGGLWQYRIEVSEAGVHRPPVSGMAGNKDACPSIVLSGGYSDDEDDGDEFLYVFISRSPSFDFSHLRLIRYTGAGGRDLSGNKRTAKQSKDQEFTRENAGLKAMHAPGKSQDAWRKGKAVRVVRSSKLSKTNHGHFAPAVPEGWKQSMRYDGTYKVVSAERVEGKSGFLVCRYKLRRDDPEPAPWSKKYKGDSLFSKAGKEATGGKAKEVDHRIDMDLGIQHEDKPVVEEV